MTNIANVITNDDINLATPPWIFLKMSVKKFFIFIAKPPFYSNNTTYAAKNPSKKGYEQCHIP